MIEDGSIIHNLQCEIYGGRIRVNHASPPSPALRWTAHFSNFFIFYFLKGEGGRLLSTIEAQ